MLFQYSDELIFIKNFYDFYAIKAPVCLLNFNFFYLAQLT